MSSDVDSAKIESGTQCFMQLLGYTKKVKRPRAKCGRKKTAKEMDKPDQDENSRSLCPD
jgi:hypothetical protein